MFNELVIKISAFAVANKYIIIGIAIGLIVGGVLWHLGGK